MKRLWAIVLIIAMIFTVSMCGCGESYIECPEFVGKSYDSVVNSDRYDMFEFKAEYVKSDKDDIGIVVAQSVEVGAKTEHGATIILSVSLGVEKSGVPNAVGQNIEVAKELMTSSGFDVSLVYAPNAEYAEGICYKTEPKAEQQFPLGAAVTLYISTGTEKKFVPYVNIVGKTLEEAKKILADGGFNVGKVIYRESEKETDTVIEQFPAYLKSIQIIEGSSVNIIIAKPKE